jgi:hypothetical protein
LQLAQWLLRRRFKCENLRRTTDAKWWQTLTWFTLQHFSVWICFILIFGILTPLSTIFQLYYSDQF